MAFYENFITSDGKNFITSDNKYLAVIQQLTGNVVLFPIENGEVDYSTKIYPRTTAENIIGLLTDADINLVWDEGYPIVINIANGTATGVDRVLYDTVKVTLSPDSDYVLPKSINVVNSSYNYDRRTGNVKLNNPTGDISVSADCLVANSSFEFTVGGSATEQIQYSQSVPNAVTIDWGDGSPVSTSAGTTVTLSHTYASQGTYTVNIRCNIDATWNLLSSFNNVNVVVLSEGSNIVAIGNQAFRDFSSLTSVTIGDSVTSIGYQAFQNCSSLTSVTIGNGVTGISEVFSWCVNLTSVTIGNGVTSIGDYAFSNCVRLTSFTCKATVPPTLDTDAFNKVPADCTIYVPADSVSAYKTASGWSARAQYIQAIPTT